MANAPAERVLASALIDGASVLKIRTVRRAPWFHRCLGLPRYQTLSFTTRGSCRVQVKDQELVITAGCFMALPAAVARDWKVTSNRWHHQTILVCDGNKVGKMLKRTFGSDTLRLELHDLAPYQSLLEEIRAEAHRADEHTAANCDQFLQILLRRLARDRTFVPSHRESRSLARYRQSLGLVSKHFRTLQTVEDLAAACDLHPVYLNRLYRKHGDTTPHRALLLHKMAFAAEQLRLTQRSIKEIAVDSGIEDPYVFSRAFKRVYGLAPSHYRERANVE